MSVAVLLIISACLPLVSFVILAFVGKRMGNPLAGMVGTFFVAGFASSAGRTVSVDDGAVAAGGSTLPGARLCALAPAAVQSLRNLGSHPHFLAASLRGVVSQRLVRTLCPDCRTSIDISEGSTGCATDGWNRNVFVTANQTCIH